MFLTPHIVVIFGASGDLTKRKLIPAIYELYSSNLLPDSFAVLGSSRTALSDNEFRERMQEFLPDDKNSNAGFLSKLYYQPINFVDPGSYEKLKSKA